MIGIENLTNMQRGHHSSTYGKIEVSLLESRYNCEELELSDFLDDVILIRINQLYRNDMSPFELYEAVRGYWKVSLSQSEKVKYALAVYDGMVLEVYEIKSWFPALTTMMQHRNDSEGLEGRYEFVGKIAPEGIRKRYKDKSVVNLFSKGSQNPIKYIMK